MEEIEMFLAAMSSIENVVILVGDCGPERIEEIFNYTKIKNCKVVFPWQQKDVQNVKERFLNDEKKGIVQLPEKIECISYYQFEGIEGEWCLCPVKCEGTDIEHMLDFNPSYIAGTINAGELSAYKLWEKSRSICKECHLKIWRNDRPPRSLDWTKDRYEKELSIIFPVYNVEDYLRNCIESVTAWKADYVEFLFVIDGTKDNSEQIIREYAQKDSRIILIQKENGGCASARQKGLELAVGRYVGFVDPDDFVDINMFHKLLKAAMEGNYDISLCGYNEYYENTGKIKPADDFICEPYISGCYDSKKIKELVTYSRVAIWRGIYSKEFLEQNNINFYTDIRRFDDLPFKVETFAFARSVVMLPENLYYYRLEREGQDVSVDDDRLYVHFDIFKHLNESIGRTRNRQLIDYYQLCKVQTHRYALEKIKDDYKDEYIRQANADLLTLMDKNRTCKIVRQLLGAEVERDVQTMMRN